MSAPILILDPQSPSERRDWAAVFHPNPVEVTGKLSELPPRAAGCLVVVHGRETLNLHATLMREACQVGFCVVVVSGGGFERPPERDFPVYYRRCPVPGRNQGIDHGLGTCAARFLESWRRTGNPPWSLLEPDPSAEHLAAISLYLEALSGGGDCASRIRRRWSQKSEIEKRGLLFGAWQEYLRHQGAREVSWRQARLPWFDDRGNVVEGGLDLDALDRPAACAAVKSVLEEPV